MERYTLDLKLPIIVRLTEAPRCESEENEMFGRNIFLHTPSGVIIEINPEHDPLFKKKIHHNTIL